ncbi:MAG: glycoside hydrolase family 15 protein [Candidatus Micrarchaeaceae archaeon]
MPLALSKKVEGNDYVKQLERWASYLVRQVSPSGFISASATYPPYSPHWIRDASFVSIGLLDFASFAKPRGIAFEDSRDAAHRINNFNCGIIEHFLNNINAALSTPLEDPDFFKLKTHIPARVNQSSDYYADTSTNDASQKESKSALIQHDSIPLILHALYKESSSFGLDDHQKEFLEKNIRTLLKYMGKTYFTESADMWEMETNALHSYDVAVIYSAFQIAKKFAEDGIISISKTEIDEIAKASFTASPLEFLKKFFIKDSVIYREKEPFSSTPSTSKSIDSAQIYFFTMFGISDKTIGLKGVEEATMAKIQKELFSSNVLPIRFLGDEYFLGGRWLNVGAEFSKYLVQKGKTKEAQGIIDYVIDKYGDRLPEQEIVDPASPNAQCPYYAINGNRPISELAWSYAAMISATSFLLENREREHLQAFKRP